MIEKQKLDEIISYEQMLINILAQSIMVRKVLDRYFRYRNSW